MIAIARGGPPGPGPAPTPVQITLYEDDLIVGAQGCRDHLADSAPGSTCEVQPVASAPDLSAPGWALTGTRGQAPNPATSWMPPDVSPWFLLILLTAAVVVAVILRKPNHRSRRPPKTITEGTHRHGLH